DRPLAVNCLVSRELRTGGHRTELEAVVGLLDPTELRDRIEVDEELRCRNPRLHHVDQGLPPGQRPRVRGRGKQGERLVERAGTGVLDAGQKHRCLIFGPRSPAQAEPAKVSTWAALDL